MIEPYVTELQCSDCGKCLPESEFRWRPSGKSRRTDCRKCESTKAFARQKSKVEWSPVEIDLLAKIYPANGSEGCREFMPNRSIAQIQTKAHRMGIKRTEKPMPPTFREKTSAWALPTHDYTPADIAWQATRIPPPPAEFRSLGVRL